MRSERRGWKKRAGGAAGRGRRAEQCSAHQMPPLLSLVHLMQQRSINFCCKAGRQHITTAPQSLPIIFKSHMCCIECKWSMPMTVWSGLKKTFSVASAAEKGCLFLLLVPRLSSAEWSRSGCSPRRPLERSLYAAILTRLHITLKYRRERG